MGDKSIYIYMTRYPFTLFGPWFFLEDRISLERRMCRGNTFLLAPLRDGVALLCAFCKSQSIPFFFFMKKSFIHFCPCHPMLVSPIYYLFYCLLTCIDDWLAHFSPSPRILPSYHISNIYVSYDSNILWQFLKLWYSCHPHLNHISLKRQVNGFHTGPIISKFSKVESRNLHFSESSPDNA